MAGAVHHALVIGHPWLLYTREKFNAICIYRRTYLICTFWTKAQPPFKICTPPNFAKPSNVYKYVYARLTCAYKCTYYWGQHREVHSIGEIVLAKMCRLGKTACRKCKYWKKFELKRKWIFTQTDVQGCLSEKLREPQIDILAHPFAPGRHSLGLQKEVFSPHHLSPEPFNWTCQGLNLQIKHMTCHRAMASCAASSGVALITEIEGGNPPVLLVFLPSIMHRDHPFPTHGRSNFFRVARMYKDEDLSAFHAALQEQLRR